MLKNSLLSALSCHCRPRLSASARGVIRIGRAVGQRRAGFVEVAKVMASAAVTDQSSHRYSQHGGHEW